MTASRFLGTVNEEHPIETLGVAGNRHSFSLVAKYRTAGQWEWITITVPREIADTLNSHLVAWSYGIPQDDGVHPFQYTEEIT